MSDKMQSNKNIIATWYVQDKKSDAWYVPQLEIKSGTAESENIYLKCACVCLASARASSKADRRLYTNIEIVPEPFNSLLKEMDVEVVCLDNTTKGSGAWSNQFYIFDIIDDLTKRDHDFGSVLVVDSDCFLRDGVDEMFSEAGNSGCLTYDLGIPSGKTMNGLTGVQMSEIEREVFGKAGLPVRYAGGEFFCASRSIVAKISALRPKLSEIMLHFERLGGGEEAHALSIIYSHLQILAGTANAWTSRLWTNFKFNNVAPDLLDSNLVVLHLPGEKRTGFSRAFERLKQQRTFSNSTEILAEDFHLPKRTSLQFAQDMAALAPGKLFRAVFKRG